jgi:translation initiation factor IF-3
LESFTRPPRFNRARPQVQSNDKHRINHRIFAREVRVVADDGAQLGVLPTKQAIQMAEERGLDLVEVSPNSEPPVCRIMDYGKFKYREQKKEAEARKNRSETETKELRIRYRTDVGDMETKLKHARDFLTEGHKVKFSMKFRGREAMHISLGREKFDKITEHLKDIAKVDEKSPMYGSFIYIVYSPLK